jgi:hypothetical protein
MNSNITQIYEINLRKYYSQLDTQISKSLIYEQKNQGEIIKSLDYIFDIVQKTTKDYIISLTLNEKKPTSLQKIKAAEMKLKEYKNKIKEIKSKYEGKEIIPKYKNEEIVKVVTNNSFNSLDKLNKAIRMTADIEHSSGRILINLEEQTKGMKNTSEKILNMNDNLSESKNSLNAMLSRQNNDKKLIIFTGGFLTLITILFVFFKLYKRYWI